MVWRKFLPPKFHKGPRGGVKRTVKPRWIGPGRLVLHELIPGQVEGDPIPIVWVVIGKTLYGCSVFSVRPLSDREQAHEEATNAIDPNKWKQLSDIIPKREYVDIEHEQPADGETEEFDLPEHPPDMRTVGTSSSRSSSRFPGVPYYVPDFSKVGPTGPMPPMRISGKKKPSDVYEQPEMVNDYGDEQAARSPSYAPTTPAKDPEPIDLEDDDFGNMPHGPLREDRRLSTTSSTPMVVIPVSLLPTAELSPSYFLRFPFRPPFRHSRIAPSHRSSPQAISHGFPSVHPVVTPVSPLPTGALPKLFPTASLPSTRSSLPYRSFPPELSPSYSPRFPFRPPSRHSRIAPSHRSSPQAISHGFLSVHPIVASIRSLPTEISPSFFPRFPLRPPSHQIRIAPSRQM